MRWLLLKDLQILRRSPLQAVLLVAYPVLIAVLVGFAISRDQDKPRVAFLNEVPSGSRISVGGARLPAVGAGDRICQRVECIDVKSREDAIEKVRSGDALAALILPSDLVRELNSLSTLRPGTPTVEVIVNQEDPVKARLVDDRITALLAQANLLIAQRIATEGGKYLNLLVNGGSFDVLGQPVSILGLRNTGRILEAVRPALPAGPLRDSLDQVIRFAGLARDNLDVAGPLVKRLAQPIGVEKQVVDGAAPLLEIFAIAVAATLTLTFVTLLLVAGSLALEREENAFPRLTRGLVSPLGPARGEGRAWDRGRLPRHAADARRDADLRGARMEPHRPLAGGDPRLGRRARCRRGGTGSRRARGSRRVVARLHDLAADRLPLPRAVRSRRPGAL